LDGHPEDEPIGLLLAAGHLQQNNTDAALQVYETLYNQADDPSPKLLNEMAWLLQQRGDTRAAQLAEAAYAKAPEDPNIADTLGWILLGQGEDQRAVTLLQQAYDAASNRSVFAYHLAFALNKLGNTAQARATLLQLLLEAPNSREADKARALLDQIED
jgi:Flp pilus assembly protein TadD